MRLQLSNPLLYYKHGDLVTLACDIQPGYGFSGEIFHILIQNTTPAPGYCDLIFFPVLGVTEKFDEIQLESVAGVVIQPTEDVPGGWQKVFLRWARTPEFVGRIMAGAKLIIVKDPDKQNNLP